MVLLRAQIQAENLKDLNKARELLRGIAERSDSSDPMIQLAGLEMEQDRLDEAAAVVAKIRGRWKEAAAPDILDAQIALKRGKIGDALAHFDVALKKDPDNKMVQFWKAQLDGRTGDVAKAAKALEADRPRQAGQGSRHRAPPSCPRPSRHWPDSRSRPAISTMRSDDSRSSRGTARTASSPAATAGC